MAGSLLQSGLYIRFIAGAICTVVLCAGPNADAREWKAREGSFKVEAELVQIRGGKVYLETASDGRVIPVPIEKLSFEDYDYLRTVTRAEIRDYLKKNPLPARGLVFQWKQEGSNDKVYFVDFSPQGDLMAVASDNGMSLYSTTTWKKVTFHKSRTIYQFRFCKFLPSGKGLLTGSLTSEVGLFSIIGGQLVEQKKMTRIHSSQIGAAAFSPDGQHVLTTDRSGKSAYWNRDTGEVLHRIKTDGYGESGSVSFINPKGTQAICGNGKSLVLFDLKAGKAIQQLPVYTSSTRMSLAPSGRLLAFSHHSGMHVKNVVTGKVESTVKQSRRKNVLFSRTGRFVVGSDSEGISVFRIPGLKPVTKFRPPEASGERCLAISPRDKFMATGYREHLSVFEMPQAN